MKKRQYLYVGAVFSAAVLAGVVVTARLHEEDFSPEFLAELDEIKAQDLFQVAEVRTSPDLSAPVRLKADGEPIDIGKLSSIAHAGPWIADVDGDGDRDLLVGDFPGYFWFFENTGSDKTPAYTSKGKLQAGGQDAKTPVY